MLARDATYGRRRFIVFARRRGSAAPSENGIDGLLSAVRLLDRAVRRDHRYEILVWDRESYPLGQPTSVELVANRAAAAARVEQLARDIQDRGVAGS